MTFSRPAFFMLLLFIVSIPFIGQTLWWLAHSQRTMGVMWYQGKSYTGQLIHEYSAIKFTTATDTSWFNTSDNIIFKPGEQVPVRYQVKNHADAKVDMFIEIWGNAVVYGGELALIIVFIFLHPSIIPRKSKIKLSSTKPFVQTV